ncbi:MAG: ribose-phosphate diphosphokinase [Clostridia bacterium]|nr:ribose-phosphate diphosphokinase [Clostridia bacterium]
MSKNDLSLLVLDNCREFGEKVEKNLLKIRKEGGKKYIANLSTCRFANGEGKIAIKDSIRDKEVYILSDVGNYGITYKFHGKDHEVMPDEHFQDIKRVISATCGHATKVTVIMPLLYESRQHRRKGRESLDCAIALQELERLGVKRIVTFDAHDPNIINAIPNLSFDNFYPTNTMIKQMIKDDKEMFEDALIISPDFGAMERARYHAEIIGCDVGVFYKRRDVSKIVNGQNPVVAHTYMGSDVKGKNILIVDDMIASGGSVIEVAEKLREMGANKICMVATFALFTSGFDKFIKAKEEGLFDVIYTTNLSYIPEEYLKYDWLKTVDMSKFVAQIIDAMDKRKPLTELFNKKKEIFKTVQKTIN